MRLTVRTGDPVMAGRFANGLLQDPDADKSGRRAFPAGASKNVERMIGSRNLSERLSDMGSRCQVSSPSQGP